MTQAPISQNKIGVAILIVLVAIAGVILSQTSGPSSMSLFSHPEVGVTFSYPDTYAPIEPRIIPGNEKYIFHREGRTDLGFELTKITNDADQTAQEFYNASLTRDSSSGKLLSEDSFTRSGVEVLQYIVEAGDIYGKITIFPSKDNKHLYSFIYFAPVSDGEAFVQEYDRVIRTLTIAK